MNKDELNEILKAIRTKYIERLKEDQLSLEQLCAMLIGKSPQDEVIDDIRNIAHRLAGISGSLGFDRIQQAASALDQSANTKSQGAINSMDAILEYSKNLVLEIKSARESSENPDTPNPESSK
ncbi:Hpt domain-containing protein [Azotobacter beijerinckii]|uniref:Hpt domain-containing protein n=1 Tax=Azotobacter beijerinckii TaxID=170623 RepID=UPI0029537620|nr:Hpt domain-containing protein [Azotobacter beijerinckii]MDV7214059.1 Hpt domain-containing protein [Azotobacter beijerinckii]